HTVSHPSAVSRKVSVRTLKNLTNFGNRDQTGSIVINAIATKRKPPIRVSTFVETTAHSSSAAGTRPPTRIEDTNPVRWKHALHGAGGCLIKNMKKWPGIPPRGVSCPPFPPSQPESCLFESGFGR